MKANMKPLLFDGCFGWLHASPLCASASRGVVLCAPWGQEAMWTHKGYRQLADRLAQAGLPTLRFDYRGTGDSIGHEAEPARLQAWLASTEAALAQLREMTGVAEVALIGVRFGATLAALAAERDGRIAKLAMLAPVVSGKTLLRELRIMQQSWQNGRRVETDPKVAAGECIEVIGHRLYRDTIESLQTIDLRHARRLPAPDVLIFDPFGRDAPALAECYAAQGARVALRPFADYHPFVIESVYSKVPDATFTELVRWAAADLTMRPADTAQAHAQIDSSPDAPQLIADGARETPVRFGNGVFGMLCEPVDVPRRGPPLLVANTGAGHHIGDGRVAVALARRLAQRGIVSLRIDIGGIGDSDAASTMTNTEPLHQKQAIDDVSDAVNWLAAHGHDRAVVFGICSGAYIGLHAALVNQHIAGLLPLNLQRFEWPQSLAIEQTFTNYGEATRVYLRSALRPDKWLRALRGRAHVLQKAKTVLKRIVARLHTEITLLLAHTFGIDAGEAGRVFKMVRSLEARGIETRFLYGEDDSSLDEATRWFGRGGRRLQSYRHVKVEVMKGVDHALFLYSAREYVMAFIEQYLDQNFGADPAPVNAASAAAPPSPDSCDLSRPANSARSSESSGSTMPAV